jgi:transposase
MLHRTRDLLVRQPTMLANTLREHLAEFGIVGASGLWQLEPGSDGPIDARVAAAEFGPGCIGLIVAQLETLAERMVAAERAIHAWHRQNEA